MDKQAKEALKNDAREAGRNVGNAVLEEASKRLLPRFVQWVRKIAARRRARR